MTTPNGRTPGNRSGKTKRQKTGNRRKKALRSGDGLGTPLKQNLPTTMIPSSIIPIALTSTATPSIPTKRITTAPTEKTGNATIASPNKKPLPNERVLVAPPGLEPRNTEPKSGVLPITLWGYRLGLSAVAGGRKPQNRPLGKKKQAQSIFSLSDENPAS